MTPRIAPLAAAISREARPFASLFVVVAVYLCLKAVFFVLTSHVGLLTPSGSPNLGLAMFAVILVGLRVGVLFIVPALVIYRLGRRATRHEPSAGSR